jgi:cell division protein FtsB
MHMAKEYQNHDVVPGEEPSVSEREQEKQLGFSMLAKLALAVAVTASLVISISCLMQFNELQKEKEEYQKKLDYYEKKIGRLQYYINQDMDDEYIAEYAREYLGYYYPDEEIYYNDDKK